MNSDPFIKPVQWTALAARQARVSALDEIARRSAARTSMLAFTQLFSKEQPYQTGWVHEEVAAHLDAFMEACERKLSPRLMIFLPPRSGKSELVSRCFPPYLLGHHPNWEVVCVSATDGFATALGMDVRNIVNHPTYRELFPKFARDPSTAAADEFLTLARGGYKALGVGGQLVGRGAHVLIIDDPISGQEMADSETQRQKLWDWYSGVARNRLAPGGGIIVMHTRWHEDDLAGRLLQLNSDGWAVYSYPAIAEEDEPHRSVGDALFPERWPLSELESLRRDMLPRHWASLYQQNPTPDDGLFFKEEWLDGHWEKPNEVPDLRCFLSVDLAIGEKTTNDYTVIAPFGVDRLGNIHYLSTMMRARLNSYDIVENMLNLAERHKVQMICIEAGHISKTLGPHLKKRMRERKLNIGTYDMVPSRDKLARAATMQARMQMGRIRFPDTSFFKDIVLRELLQFPAGKHDDCVDAMAYAALFVDKYMLPLGAKPAVDTEPVKWSYDWIKKYGKSGRKDDDAKTHVPPRLNGRARSVPKKHD